MCMGDNITVPRFMMILTSDKKKYIILNHRQPVLVVSPGPVVVDVFPRADVVDVGMAGVVDFRIRGVVDDGTAG